MAKNYIQPGQVLDHAPTAAVVSGQLLIIGILAGIALGNIAIGQVGSVQVEGVFELPKEATTTTGAQGAKAYVIAASGLVTGVATGNTLIGVFSEPAVSGPATCRVKLNAA